VRQFQVEDGRGWWETAGDGGGRWVTVDDDRALWVTVGDDTMSSVLVIGSYLSGKFRK